MTELVGFDLETYLIQPGKQCPKPVVASIGGELYDRWDEVETTMRRALSHGYVFVGQNIAYDMAVLLNAFPAWGRLIFDLYDAGKIIDTQHLAKLVDIKHGLRDYGYKYSLAACANRWLGRELDKGDDGWRLRYGTLDGIPLRDWPQRATDYAKDDSLVVVDLAEKLKWEDYPDLRRQAKWGFGLNLMSYYGMRTDLKRIGDLEAHWLECQVRAWSQLVSAGLLRGDGTKDTKAMQALLGSLEVDIPKTKTGKFSTAKETLEALAARTDSPELQAWVDYVHADKMLTTYVKALRAGLDVPIHPYVDTIRATGRTSMSRPNLQNLPRDVDGVPSIRGCFTPREGNTYINADFDTAELRALGATCLEVVGWSRIAEAYQQDPKADLHTIMAAGLLGVSIEEAYRMKADGAPALKEARQEKAKAANFGFPGGMGITKFCETQAKAGKHYTEAEAKSLKEAYFKAYPEMRPYFSWVSAKADAGDLFVTSWSQRARGGCGFCDGANNGFQAPIADAAKYALYEVTKECFLGDLRGARPCNFVHDEIMLEAPEDRAEEFKDKVVSIMERCGSEVLGTVPMTAEGKVSKIWKK